MGLFQLTQGLNREGQGHLVDPMNQTHEGMAHFAGTGPPGRTCRECFHWMAKRKWARDKSLGRYGGPMDSRCRMHRILTMRHRGPVVPHDAKACKHFEESDRPQPLKRPEDFRMGDAP